MAKVGAVRVDVVPNMRRMRSVVEGKVVAGAAGAGLAAPIAGLVLWLVEDYWLHRPVPAPLELFVLAIVPLLVAFATGWLAPHTDRPDLDEPGLVGGSPLAELMHAVVPPAPTVNVYAGNSAREHLGPRADELTVTGDAGQVLDFTTAASARPGREPAPDMSTASGRPAWQDNVLGRPEPTWLGQGVGADVDEFEAGQGPKATPPPD